MNEQNQDNSQPKPPTQAKSPNGGTLTGIAGVLTALAAVFTSIGAPEFFPVQAKKIGLGFLTQENVEEPTAQATTWNGVFQHFEKDTENRGDFVSKIATEKVQLAFSGTKVTGKSEATGTSSSNPKGWEQSGYKKGNYLVLAYERIEKDIPGIGTYFLERNGSGNNTYVGYWEGLDCDVKSIVRCPYVLSKDDVNRIKGDFKDHLKTSCEKINSPGDFSSCG